MSPFVRVARELANDDDGDLLDSDGALEAGTADAGEEWCTFEVNKGTGRVRVKLGDDNDADSFPPSDKTSRLLFRLIEEPDYSSTEALKLLIWDEWVGLTRGRVYVVSPWIRDIELPLAQAGFFDGLLANRDAISFVDLLRLVAARHDLVLVTKPPEELVHFGSIRRLDERQAARRELKASEEVRGISVVEMLEAVLEQDMRDLVDEVLTHWETLRIGWDLARSGARLYYARKLHAKLLWTPVGAIAGSANFTGGGFARNDELMVEMTAAAVLAALADFATGLTQRAAVAGSYRIRYALERANLSVAQLDALLDSSVTEHEPAMNELLQNLRVMS